MLDRQTSICYTVFMENEINYEVVVLYLCESEQIILKPNQLYKFEVKEDCERCKELAKLADF